MVDGIRYEPSRSGIQAYGLSPELRAVVMQVGAALKSAAVANSPTQTGAYKSSFYVVPGEVRISGGPRGSALVINTAPYAAGVEWRNGQRPLGRAARAFGGKAFGSASRPSRRGRGAASSKASAPSKSRPRRPSARG